jgi:hypothetical protein
LTGTCAARPAPVNFTGLVPHKCDGASGTTSRLHLWAGPVQDVFQPIGPDPRFPCAHRLDIRARGRVRSKASTDGSDPRYWLPDAVRRSSTSARGRVDSGQLQPTRIGPRLPRAWLDTHQAWAGDPAIVDELGSDCPRFETAHQIAATFPAETTDPSANYVLTIWNRATERPLFPDGSPRAEAHDTPHAGGSAWHSQAPNRPETVSRQFPPPTRPKSAPKPRKNLVDRSCSSRRAVLDSLSHAGGRSGCLAASRIARDSRRQFPARSNVFFRPSARHETLRRAAHFAIRLAAPLIVLPRNLPRGKGRG